MLFIVYMMRTNDCKSHTPTMTRSTYIHGAHSTQDTQIHTHTPYETTHTHPSKQFFISTPLLDISKIKTFKWKRSIKLRKNYIYKQTKLRITMRLNQKHPLIR